MASDLSLSNVQEIGVNARCGCSVPKWCVGQHRSRADRPRRQRQADRTATHHAALTRRRVPRPLPNNALPIRSNHFIYRELITDSTYENFPNLPFVSTEGSTPFTKTDTVS